MIPYIKLYDSNYFKNPYKKDHVICDIFDYEDREGDIGSVSPSDDLEKYDNFKLVYEVDYNTRKPRIGTFVLGESPNNRNDRVALNSFDDILEHGMCSFTMIKKDNQ